MEFDKTWPALFIFLGFTTVIAFDCDFEEISCSEKPLELCNFEISEDLIPWNETQLQPVCKKFLTYFECYESHKMSSDGLCGWPRVLQNAKKMIVELCSKPSSLHTRYMDHISCIKKALDLYENVCANVSERVYNTFISIPGTEPLCETISSVERCIKVSQINFCRFQAIEKVCSEDAADTFNLFLRESKFYLLNCHNVQQFARASTLLYFLNQQGIQIK